MNKSMMIINSYIVRNYHYCPSSLATVHYYICVMDCDFFRSKNIFTRQTT
ncbi:MAG: hypothetical protein FWH29_04395 [Methanobrevibacter sp.]|nr:hypothetical protein [Methanobrevibacter sp.]